MKKSELKKILKPLVNECIKESLLEDGLISGIIAEVVRGVGVPQPIVETVAPKADPVKERMRRNAFTQEQSTKLKEHKSKLMSAIGGGSYNGVNLQHQPQDKLHRRSRHHHCLANLPEMPA